jgi:DNA-binding NarL/FixJ family response regulator
MSVPEVAARLKRSPKTIEQHKAAIGRKLGDSTLSGIARAVAEIGIDEEHLRAHAIDVFRTASGDA